MINKTNKELVKALRQDARTKLTTLARKTGLAVSTLFERVHDLDSIGIQKLTAILEHEKLGYTTKVTMFLKLKERQKQEKFVEYLRDNPNVDRLIRVDNGYDFLIDCVFKDMRELEQFCETIEDKGVNQKELHFCIEEYFREAFNLEKAEQTEANA